MKTNWEKRFMDLARNISTWSKDNSTKVGAIVVDTEHTILSVGYNGNPRGLRDEVEERNERPLKYMYVVHAEINAIINATRNGVSLKNSILYCTYFPCNECAKAIINSGIKTLVTYEPNFGHERWGKSFRISYEMLKECGVNIIYFSDENDDFYSRFLEILGKRINDDDYVSLEWDYKVNSEAINYFGTQKDWNQTLITKFNQSSAMIIKENQKSGANKIRINKKLFNLISDLEFFNNSTMKISNKYHIIIDNQLPENEIIVYYDGQGGLSEKEEKFNYLLIKVLNHELI